MGMGLKNYHKKTPLQGQGPYNPPPPDKLDCCKVNTKIEKNQVFH